MGAAVGGVQPGIAAVGILLDQGTVRRQSRARALRQSDAVAVQGQGIGVVVVIVLIREVFVQQLRVPGEAAGGDQDGAGVEDQFLAPGALRIDPADLAVPVPLDLRSCGIEKKVVAALDDHVFHLRGDHLEVAEGVLSGLQSAAVGGAGEADGLQPVDVAPGVVEKLP